MMCPICYREARASETYHPACAKKLFGTPSPPELTYHLSDMDRLAEQVIRSSLAVTGVQPKLSLALERSRSQGSKVTLVGLWGDYILKPPVSPYPHLPENESITMRMAADCGLATVPQGLIKLASGEWAYLTRRIDRNKGGKVAMEDMCQLTERLTEDKYKGSYEQIAKVIRRHTSNPGYDVLTFFEALIFCFITGNADMHLKNFSLITHADGQISLAPLYDLLATKLALPDDHEETALSLNGKKSKFHLRDFLDFASTLGLSPKVTASSLDRILSRKDRLGALIQASYLPPFQQNTYRELLDERIRRLMA